MVLLFFLNEISCVAWQKEEENFIQQYALKQESFPSATWVLDETIYGTEVLCRHGGDSIGHWQSLTIAMQVKWNGSISTDYLMIKNLNIGPPEKQRDSFMISSVLAE